MESALITQYIQNVLQRDPFPGEVASYQAIIDNNDATLEQVLASIVNGEEAVTDVYPVVLTYQAIYGRVPDPAGLNYWVDVYRSIQHLDDPATTTQNEALVELLKAFVDPTLTPEFVDRYGANPTGDQFVAAAYQNVLNRTPDQAGLIYWQTRYAEVEASLAGSGLTQQQITIMTRAIILEQFVSSAEYRTEADEEVDAYLTDLANEVPIPADQSLWDYSINDTTFTLTPQTDSGPAFEGTNGDDTYNGEVQQTAFLPIQTLTDGDDLDGKEGRDTLNAGLVNLFTVPAGLHNIEVVNLSTPGILFGLGFFRPTLDVANADSIDTLSLRGMSNGAVINNLTTKLDTLEIRDVISNVFGTSQFEINHVGSALDGADDSLDIKLNNVGWNGIGMFAPVQIDLDTNSANANAGYETLNIDSSGLPSWVELFGSATEATSTVNITGNADLDINDNFNSWAVWDAETLDLIDATSFTGNLFTTVGGMGAVEVRGGSGDDELRFQNEVDATVFGNDGNDIFRFQRDGADPSFNVDDFADGGDGNDELWIGAEEGPLLLTGVGPNIVNIERIVHANPTTGTLTVDMSRSGSAFELQLMGDYNNNNVEVSELTNDDLVIYSGDNGDIEDLTLDHVSAFGILDTVSLRIEDGSDIEGDLIVPFNPLDPINKIEALLLEVLDPTELTRIEGADQINTDILLTGDGDLELGDEGAYDFENGVINASAFTGTFTVFIGDENQHVIGGLGDDLIVVTTDSTNPASFDGDDLIDLSFGGADRVRFLDSTDEDNGELTGEDYHEVVGFDVADDVIELDASNMASGGGLDFTDSGSVSFGDPVVMYDYVNGSNPDLDAGGADTNFNFIKFTTGVNTLGLDAEDAVDLALAGGTINVQNINGEFLAAFYDNTNSQMVLFVWDETGGLISDSDDIEVIATVGMSFADYQAFDGTNLAFV